MTVTLYTRPGCPWSIRLERRLRRAGVAYDRIDIWSDDDAAAFVRSVARGHETVPTLVVGDQVLVNPKAATAIDAIEVLRAS
jgi:mycoredoxin